MRNNIKIKSQNGITLTALVMYIILFVIVIGIMTNISQSFFSNVGKIKDYPEYISEFNKFSMFFIADVKRNSKIASIKENYLELEDGTKYTYSQNAVYRNDTKLAEHILNFSFQTYKYTQDSFTKDIIKVSTTIGENESKISKEIEFVLKYW